MSNELQSLSEIYNNSIFRVPDYQRGYAWLKKQLTDFWEDIVNLPVGKNHYTGALSIKRVTENLAAYENEAWLLANGYKLYHIVDGQQRLTTVTILLHELIAFSMSIEADGKEDEIYLCSSSLRDIREKYVCRKMPPKGLVTTYLFGYDKGNAASAFLIHNVFDEPHGGAVGESFYTKNLLEAKDFFAKRVKEVYDRSGMSGLDELFRKVTQQLKFNIHDIDGEYDVYVAFETMNNRGKKLTNLELLKNRLMYLTTLFDDDEAERKAVRDNINNAWGQIYYQLGRNKDPLSDDEFLRAHWITYYRYSRRKGDDYIEFLLGHFSAKNVFEEYVVAEEAHGECPLSDYEDVEDRDDEQDDVEDKRERLTLTEINDYVNSLKDFAQYWYYSWFPFDASFRASQEEKTCIDRLNRIGIGYFRPLVVAALSLEGAVQAKDRCALYDEIERFIFVYFRLGGYQANFRSSDYYNKSRQLMKGGCSIKEVTDSLKELTDDSDSAIGSFAARVRKMFNDGGGYYYWWAKRYFFFEYEAYLTCEKGIQRDGDLASWRLFTTEQRDLVSIEHILPQTPTEWYWRNQFRDYSPEEINILSGSLGNLLALSKKVNSSLQNDSFEEKKKPKNGRRGYIYGSHSETEVAQYADWSAESIYERGMKLLDFMEKRWKIRISDEDKRRLLNIEFVHDGREKNPTLKKVAAEDYAKFVTDTLLGEDDLCWVSGNDKDKVWFTTDAVDGIVSGELKYTWDGGRLVVYEICADEKRGIILSCRISKRTDNAAKGVFRKCLEHTETGGVPYDEIERRRRWIEVFRREVLSADDMANGVTENAETIKTRLRMLLENDVKNWETEVFG